MCLGCLVFLIDIYFYLILGVIVVVSIFIIVILSLDWFFVIKKFILFCRFGGVKYVLYVIVVVWIVFFVFMMLLFIVKCVEKYYIFNIDF